MKLQGLFCLAQYHFFKDGDLPVERQGINILVDDDDVG
jgi:hypothetical protein